MPAGQCARLADTWGWSRIVNQVISAVSARTAHQTREAIRCARPAIGSVVFIPTQSAPCIVRAASEASPTITVYQSRIPAFDRDEVGPERLEEAPVGVDQHPAHDVSERRAEDDGEEDARAREEDVPQRCPRRALDVVPELDREAAQDEEPEDDHEGEIEAAERRRVERREREVESRRPRAARPRCRPTRGRSSRARRAARRASSPRRCTAPAPR